MKERLSQILGKLASVIELELFCLNRLVLDRHALPSGLYKGRKDRTRWYNQSYTKIQCKATRLTGRRVLRYSSGLIQYKSMSFRLTSISAFVKANQTSS